MSGDLPDGQRSISLRRNSPGRNPMKIVTLIALSMFTLGTHQAAAQTAKTTLKNAEGKNVGSAELSQLPAGVLIKLSLNGVPSGEHAFHVHAAGKCEPPFTSAGGHFNPDS